MSEFEFQPIHIKWDVPNNWTKFMGCDLWNFIDDNIEISSWCHVCVCYTIYWLIVLGSDIKVELLVMEIYVNCGSTTYYMGLLAWTSWKWGKPPFLFLNIKLGILALYQKKKLGILALNV
jgi:hypothetical protein